MKHEVTKIYDISPEVSSNTAVFPGDTVFSAKVLMDCAHGDGFGLSAITTTPHVGAHADAPLHYVAHGAGISERSLKYYLGPCQVICVSVPRGERLQPHHVELNQIQTPRVLFCTNSFPNPNLWNNDFNALSPELIQALAEKKVILVGIDTPSVDLAEDKVLNTHHQIHKHDMAILEGLVLKEVPAGIYNLSALPLKMKGVDASPVRAVLWT